MTAALELAGVSPDLLDAIVAQVTAKLSLVVSRPALSMLAASKRRRDCERRQADAVRGDRSPDGLSLIPSTVRKREWKRRRAAAKKAGSIPDRSPPHVVQGEARDQKHAEVRGTSEATGPLAGTVAGILGRTFGATNLRLRKAYQAIRTGVGIGSKGQIQLGEMWAKTSSEKADARLLVEEFTIPQIKDVAVSVGATWKPDAKSPRVTVGLVLSRLVALRDGSGPAKRRAPKAPAEVHANPRATGENRNRPPSAPMAAPRTTFARGEQSSSGPPVVTTKAAPEIPTMSTRSPAPALWLGEKPPAGEVRPAKEQIALILAELEERRGGGP